MRAACHEDLPGWADNEWIGLGLCWSHPVFTAEVKS
jgi:hypothetical protein